MEQPPTMASQIKLEREPLNGQARRITRLLTVIATTATFVLSGPGLASADSSTKTIEEQLKELEAASFELQSKQKPKLSEIDKISHKMRVANLSKLVANRFQMPTLGILEIEKSAKRDYEKLGVYFENRLIGRIISKMSKFTKRELLDAVAKILDDNEIKSTPSLLEDQVIMDSGAQDMLNEWGWKLSKEKRFLIRHDDIGYPLNVHTKSVRFTTKGKDTLILIISDYDGPVFTITFIDKVLQKKVNNLHLLHP